MSGRAEQALSEALRGTLGAQYELAVILEEEEKDIELAGAWFKKAAMQGHVGAAYRVGLLCASDWRTQAEAPYWLYQAAMAGHADAQFRLGEMYERGFAIEADAAASEFWYRTAAQQGHTLAMSKLF